MLIFSVFCFNFDLMKLLYYIPATRFSLNLLGTSVDEDIKSGPFRKTEFNNMGLIVAAASYTILLFSGLFGFCTTKIGAICAIC